jgi:hypothetical protein
MQIASWKVTNVFGALKVKEQFQKHNIGREKIG